MFFIAYMASVENNATGRAAADAQKGMYDD